MKMKTYLNFVFLSSLLATIAFSLFGFKTTGHDPEGCNLPPKTLDASLFCQEPTNLTFSNFGTDFDFFWNSVFNATGYQLEIGQLGFEPGIGEGVFETETNSAFYFNLSILDGGTHYEAYVRTICNNGETSVFGGPFPFFVPPTCGDKFYDSGGANGDIDPDEELNITICPDPPGEFVHLVFNEIDVDPCCSIMKIVIDNQISIIPLDGSHPSHLSSYQTGGCLTFQFFTTNDTSCGSGWDISVECVTCPTVPFPSIQRVSIDEIHLWWGNLGLIQDIEWELGAPGFLPFDGNEELSGSAFLLPSGLNLPIDGLSPNTPYDLYFRTNCNGAFSLPSPPMQVRTAPTCGDKYFDQGGPAGPAGINTTTGSSMISCPEQAGEAIYVTFESFDLGTNGAQLTILDGGSPNDPMLAILNGMDAPDTLFSSHQTGCLGFWYSSNDPSDIPGWEANINCTTCPPINGFGVESTSIEGAVIFWTPTLNANSYQWEVGEPDFKPGTGNAIVSGVSPSNENFTEVSGLERNTIYEIYVRGTCDAENSSYLHSYLFSTQATCGDFFYDPGGPNDQYGHDIYLQTTICSTEPNDPVTVQFNLFSIHIIGDFLRVYDGDNILSNFLGFYSGSVSPDPFTSTHASGCLTFEFQSNGTIAGNGWEASVFCNATPVIETIAPNTQFELFPNPTTNEINIVLKEKWASDQTVEVRDVNGILIYGGELNGQPFSIPTHTWPTGTYFVVLKNSEKAVTRRFVKM